ncbi:hypothetical protein A6E09_17550 [Aliivibrio fischeri]|nr:hypothetical protein A6E09_17550 [Aliivibrio fischeri]
MQALGHKINKGVQMLSVIVAASVGGLISFIAFHYKDKKHVKEKFNESLFNLLSVWTSISMINFLYSEEYKKALLEGIKRKFPYENVPDNYLDSMMGKMKVMVPVIAQEELYLMYNKSILELANIEPLLAFRLSSNQFLLKYLKAIEVNADLENEPNMDLFLESFSKFTHKNSLKELESDLLELAKRSGRSNYKEIKLHINKIKSRSNTIEDSLIDDYLKQVIDPVIKKITSNK